MNPQLQERRNRRSEQVSRALQYQLDAAHDRHGFDMLLVADDDGLLLASHGPAEATEALAACAPLLHRSAHGQTRGRLLAMLARWVPGATADGVHVRPITIDDEAWYLCAVGPRTTRSDAALHRVQLGARRILAEGRG